MPSTAPRLTEGKIGTGLYEKGFKLLKRSQRVNHRVRVGFGTEIETGSVLSWSHEFGTEIVGMEQGTPHDGEIRMATRTTEAEDRAEDSQRCAHALCRICVVTLTQRIVFLG